MPTHRLIQGDARHLAGIADDSVHCCITSPPYFGLRDYQADGQIGQEPTPEEFVEAIVACARQVRRVLRPDGTFWLNLGDSSRSRQRGSTRAGPRRKPKDLIGIPWMAAFALRDDGWYLRSDVIWHKPNAMPGGARDRPARAHEHLFLLTRRPTYYYDAEAVKEPAADVTLTRHKPDVWTIPTRSYRGAHFACFPPDLVVPCIRAGTSEKGCCAQCGSPLVRVVERQRVPTRPGVRSKVYTDPPSDQAGPRVAHHGAVCGNRDPLRHVTRTRTVGWRETCDCAYGCDCEPLRIGGHVIHAGYCQAARQPTPIPCTVLDPFAGACTTSVVADRLGRHSLAVDLSQDYLDLGRKRLIDDRQRRDLAGLRAHRAKIRADRKAARLAVHLPRQQIFPALLTEGIDGLSETADTTLVS